MNNKPAPQSPTKVDNEPSNSAIALLCQINEFTPDEASAEQKTHLQELIDGGFVEIDPHPSRADTRYKPTRRGVDFLSMRGASMNES